ncbi:emp24/gp25L/p24 family/GOLD-domain-containing protein [Radiomyces spectabilis]|uniref:emp24/gp25L/p24 family/GOLD-domain-containing protein n=1 Tax=Radiomyces spectabilis TaxID=64574 RepID=UPI002220E156|nr:emp24/gp25L/p24 family/GOLD-domain-containing protein [Radiomyces spectabilis]KAI8379709.1 emp24/gp25L/p24 family/GOLD-domain-containing protein [Radiomyces spectabilis]
MTRFLLFATALFVCLQSILAVSIDIGPHKKECFFEDLNVGDKLTVTFQVGEGGNLDIDFSIVDPQGSLIKNERQMAGTHVVQANREGRYVYCFSNEMSSVTAKSLSFNVHDMERLQETAQQHIDPLEREIRELAESIFAIKSEQDFFEQREKQHRNTAESTNSRVKWWSLGQLSLLAAVCMWQIYYLKRFFEVKRVV